jgi:hypothetical protein
MRLPHRVPCPRRARQPPRWRARSRSPRSRSSRGSGQRCRRRSRACPAPHSSRVAGDRRRTKRVRGRGPDVRSRGTPRCGSRSGRARRGGVAGAPRRRCRLRAADGERPSPDEAGQGDLSSGLAPARACERSGSCRGSRPRRSTARLYGTRRTGSGGRAGDGDGPAIALLGPGSPQPLGRRRPPRPNPGSPRARLPSRSPRKSPSGSACSATRPPRDLLELRPENLGTVHLAARLEGRQLTLEIRAELAQSRDLLQQALPQLRELLVSRASTRARDHPPGPRHRRPRLLGAAFRRGGLFKRDEALPGAVAPDGAPVRRRQPGPGGFDFLV